MRARNALLLSVALVTACGTDPGTTDMTGTWVLTFPALFVTSYGFNCTSLSGTVLQVEQDGNHVTAPYEQGLLTCAAGPFDSTAVPFSQGVIEGTMDGNHLDVGFVGAAGRFTGTVKGTTASGNVDYTDPTYNVGVSGSWIATRRTPTGAMNVTFTTSSMTGQPLPNPLVTVDGDTTMQAPQNGMMSFTGLTQGQHLIRVATGSGQSCSVLGGPSGAVTGTNPNDQFVEINEDGPPLVFTYHVACS